MNITDISTLGTLYSVADNDGKILKSIQIIPHTSILDAALGEYNETFESFSSYLEKSVAVMTGFNIVDPNKVLWYSTEDDEVVLSEVIEYAITNGYDKIILEHLEIIDSDF